MNVTTELIIGGPAPVATLDQVAAYFLGNDARKVDDTGVAEIVNALWEYGGRVGINPAIAASQIAHETNRLGFGGDVTPNQHNPAGIGTTGGGVKGSIFSDWRAGIAAYFVHLLTWCQRDDLAFLITTSPSTLDPRVPLVRAQRTLQGAATTWASLAGRWAVPGDNYAAGIERHYAGILALPAGSSATKGPDMTVSAPPIDKSHPSPNRGGYANPHEPRAVCWHITDGVNSLGWLTNPASGASSNYLIARNGTIYELVPPTESAWANGKVNKPDLSNPVIAQAIKEKRNLNTVSISIEHEGKTSAGQGGSLTTQQVDATVELTAWLCARFAIAPDQTHILGHYEIDSVDRANCPGFSAQEWNRWVLLVSTLVGQPPPPVVDNAAVSQRLNERGELLVEVNFGGTATKILGVNYQNLGGSVENAAGERYDRSLQDGVFGPWVRR